MVTRSSLVWVMTGIAAGIAGGWLWNRERAVDVAPSVAAVTPTEPIRSPFTQRREERATYLTPSDTSSEREHAQPSSAFSHRQAVYDSASRADRDQLAAMIAAARALTNPIERRSRLEVLLLRYAELDVDGALAHALENDQPTAAHLLAVLTVIAPEQTWERAKQVTNPAERFAYLDAVAGALAEQDPERAFAHVADLPAEWQRTELLRLAAINIAAHDPRLAIRLAETQGTLVARQLTELIATQWSRQNPSEAARWVEGLPRPEQARLAYRVADAYVAQKPTEALAWAERLAGSPQRFLWSSMLGTMAKYDPDQALRIAQAADSPAQRTQALGQVLAAIAQTDPSMALTQLQKIPAGRMRTQILTQVVQSVAALTPATALDWLEEIDDKPTQLEAARTLGWTLSRYNVEAAAGLIERVPKEVRSTWITAVATAYADLDVEKGRQWVRRYGNDSEETVTQFAQAVATRDPELAIQLVEGVVNDEERDRLLAGLLRPLAEHSPAQAARLAERVTDEQKRARSVSDVASVWGQYDLPAARKWVMSLDDGQMKDQALTSLLQRGGGSLDDVVPIINEIRTPERRSHAVLVAAMRLSQNDLESARTLLRRYPLDPARQRQFDEFLQQRRIRGP